MMYMRSSASGPLNRRPQAQLKAAAPRPKAALAHEPQAAVRRPSTSRGTSGPGRKESRDSPPRRSPWQTSLWQGGLLRGRESQAGIAPAVRVTRSTSPRLPSGRSELRGSRGPAGSNGREVDVLKAGMMQSIRRMQHQLEKPRARTGNSVGRFSNACREPAVPRAGDQPTAQPTEFIGCREAVQTAAALLLQRHWRKRRRFKSAVERRCNSLRAIEKFSPHPRGAHFAAARIQRAWRVWNWRRAFVNYSEHQIGWLGHFDWLLRHRKVFGTELATAEDAAQWTREKRSAPPDAEIDPWGHRELRRHLAAQSSADGAPPETAAAPLKATAHCVVGAHLTERLRRSAMKPKDDSKLCKTISSLEPPTVQRPRIMTQRYTVALSVGASCTSGAAAALVSPRCDFRTTLEATAVPAVPILRPTWTSSQAVLAQAPRCGPLLRCRARTPQPTPRPMLRLWTQSPRWAHSPSPSSRASVAQHAAVALAMPWKLPGTVPCR